MKLLRKKLSNGMTVIMEPREIPVVSFSIANPFASASEDSKVKGIAHFMEHLVFTGTKTRTHEDISREIEKKGGILNAFTHNEVTAFWFKLPSEHLFSGIDILADMLNDPSFNEEKFEKEKKVVLEEVKMYHDDPRTHVVAEQIQANLYKAPFGENYIIGSEKTLVPLKRDFVANFFKENYNPRNFVVTIVGKADFDKVCNYLEGKFNSSDSEIKPLIEIKKHNKSTIEEREGIDQAHFAFAVHAPLPTDPNYYVLEVLDAYLAHGMSSRLFLEIREKRGLAYAVRGSVESEKNYSHYVIYVGTTKEALQEVEKIILKEIKDIEKITEKNLEEAKQQLIGLKKVTSEESVNVMNELMYSELCSSADEYYQYEEKINSITLEQVKKLAKELFKKYSTAAIVPK